MKTLKDYEFEIEIWNQKKGEMDYPKVVSVDELRESSIEDVKGIRKAEDSYPVSIGNEYDKFVNEGTIEHGNLVENYLMLKYNLTEEDIK